MSGGAGRNSYNMNDDEAMLKFLIKELKSNPDLAKSSVRGLEIWKKAEKAKITKHTHQSMSTRVRRFLLTDLEIQPISVEDKKYLKSVLSLSDNNADESSSETDNGNGNNVGDKESAATSVAYDKRQPFTENEDLELLKFLIAEIRSHNPWTENPGGRALWKCAAKKKILQRTTDSMATRFSRYLYGKYNDLAYVPQEMKNFLNQRLKPQQYQESANGKSSKSETADPTAPVKVPENFEKFLKSNADGRRSSLRKEFDAVHKSNKFSPPKKSPPKKRVIYSISDDEELDVSPKKPDTRIPNIKSNRSIFSKFVESNPNVISSDEDVAKFSGKNAVSVKKAKLNVVSPASSLSRELSSPAEGKSSSVVSVDGIGIDDTDVREVETERIINDGGHLTNNSQFKMIMFDHVVKGTFKSMEDLNEFQQKLRLIEALCFYYRKTYDEIIDLIKSNDNDIRKAERAIVQKTEEKSG